MSETKDLIKRLDAFIKNESYWIVPTGCTLFKEIKSFLEQQYQHEQNILNYGTDEPEEQQAQPVDQVGINKINSHPIPQPDEQLVEDILDLGCKVCKHGERLIPKIRILLQSHRPSVTREEIENIIKFSQECWILCIPNEPVVEYILEFLKSKGIEVKEKP